MQRAALSLRQRLTDAMDDVLALVPQLERVVHLKPGKPSLSLMHARVSHSSPPWNGQIAGTLLDLHAEARDREQRLRLLLGLPYRDRGGSDGNTSAALGAFKNLCAAADDGAVSDTASWLESWARRARTCLGETEEIRQLPRQPGGMMTVISPLPVTGPAPAPPRWAKAAAAKLKRDRQSYAEFRAADQQQHEREYVERLAAAVAEAEDDLRLWQEDVNVLEPEAAKALTAFRAAEDRAREAGEYARQESGTFWGRLRRGRYRIRRPPTTAPDPHPCP